MIANVQAGKALKNPTVSVSFPTGDSKGDESARLTAASITLQNLNGPGKGCPVVSTTFPLQQKAIGAGTNASTSPSNLSVESQPAPAPAPSNGNNSGGLDAATIENLAPELGFQSGLNPTGSGDCDGAVNGADGQPIKIPCSCPPPQDVYLDVCYVFLLDRRVLTSFFFIIGACRERSGWVRCKQSLSQSWIPNRRFEAKPECSDHRGVDHITKLEWGWKGVPRCKYDAVGEAEGFVRISIRVASDMFTSIVLTPGGFFFTSGPWISHRVTSIPPPLYYLRSFLSNCTESCHYLSHGCTVLPFICFHGENTEESSPRVLNLAE